MSARESGSANASASVRIQTSERECECAYSNGRANTSNNVYRRCVFETIVSMDDACVWYERATTNVLS